MQDGARVANIALLKGLSALGVTIDVIAVANQDEVCDPDLLRQTCGVSRVYIVRKSAGPIKLLTLLGGLVLRPWLAVTLAPFAGSRVAKEIDTILEQGPEPGQHWSALLYDGLHPAAHASSWGKFRRPRPLRPDTPIFYRAHNVESDIWRRKAALTQFLPLKMFFGFQASLMGRFEASVLTHAKAVFPVSDADLEVFRRLLPNLTGLTVPIGYAFDTAPVPPTHPNLLLFLGRLDWPPNREGLTWFLEKVWPEVMRQRPELELKIAGSGDASWLHDLTELPGVHFLGRVDSVEALYRQCSVCIVPIFYGSGTRVKAIEASRYGRPCLSTSLGVEGLGLEPGQTYYQAETPQQWITALVRLDGKDASFIGHRAFTSMQATFDLTQAARTLLPFLS